MFTVVIQLLIVNFGGKTLKSSKLTMSEHLVCILIGTSSLVFGFVFKVVFTLIDSRCVDKK